MAQPPRELFEFLREAELEHYYNGFKSDLKVATVQQIKYVEDEDLQDLGMTKPEMRRLKKFYKKECPHSTFSKIKKILAKGEKDGLQVSAPIPEGSPTPQIRPSSKHIIPEDAISLCKTLGKGEFGTVEQGIWTNEEGERVQVAVKCLNKEKLQTGTSDFLKEATIMHTVDHPNIVRLYGVVLGSEKLLLVSELAPLRSLLECVKEPSLRCSFPVLVLSEFAVQIASGMAYLEDKRLIHRDLAARNILVFSKDTVKVSDFGLSRALGVGRDYYQTNFSVNLKLPIAWCAPECINFLKFTSASDVWAFGVTLWEMFSYGFQPWAGCTGGQKSHIQVCETPELEPESWKVCQKILEAIDEPNCQRLEQPECCPKEIYGILLKCWEHIPEKRPKFSELQILLPQVKPLQVQAAQDCPLPGDRKDMLFYKTGDVITVLDKRPDPLSASLWKGVTDNGKTGLFISTETAPYLNVDVASPLRHKMKRSESSRKSNRTSKVPSSSKLRADMISRPQNDLRHTGHIGYDGAVFGDVAFIGDNYDKLPVKVVAPYKPQNDMPGSNGSLPKGVDPSIINSQSSVSIGNSTVRSDDDSGTLTDVSSFQGDMSGSFFKPHSNGKDVDDFGDLGDFKMPDFSCLDLGPSLMDEVLKAIDSRQDPATSVMEEDTAKSEDEGSPIFDRSPLIEREAPRFARQDSAFDNFAMSADDLSVRDNDSDSTADNVSDDMRGSKESTPESRLSDFSYSGSSDKKKSKLKLVVDMKCPLSHIKPMSASDERVVEQAIARANELSEESAQNSFLLSSPSPTDLGEVSLSPSSSGGSPRLLGLFSRKKSPKLEKRSFADEIASLSSDLSEDVTMESQEAYNELVARSSSSLERVRDSSEERRKTARERRARRAMEHQQQASGSGFDLTSDRERNGKSRNQNIRAPVGIPTRGSRFGGVPEEKPTDDNPLRRLRDSGSAFPLHGRMTRSGCSEAGDRTSSSEKLDMPASQSLDSLGGRSFISGPIINSRASPTTTHRNGYQVGSDALSRENNVSEGASDEDPPLPPRRPLKPGTVNVKPRERRYQLDLGQAKSNEPVKCSSIAAKEQPVNNNILNTSNESSDSVFSESETSTHSGKMPDFHGQFCVKNVKLSAEDLGLNDQSDEFWVRQVNFEEHAHSEGEAADDMVPMSGRYKTSDNVSYEDLLEFALDDTERKKRSRLAREGADQSVCDEIRVMRRVLSKDVTVEDCMMALDETEWNIHNAIKYLKLKQLLSVQLGTKDQCKGALMHCQWNVSQAAGLMLSRPSGRSSPECVDV